MCRGEDHPSADLAGNAFKCPEKHHSYLHFLFFQGGETHKPGYGSGKFLERQKGHKGYDAQGTLSKIFKLGSSGSRPGSRSGSPVARR
ncbi:hypothetical protein JD844_016524 [Phrynosoma platyrhinos]|uniref:Myelin basic protein n=1 Tax=Phrynosoma platyrhinos TaxID=52577 RepID=A0ABQ7SKN3_PHRPL|nr:hypothetical protein JD844_016524 [Phrynosoma platyrhinos]